MPYRSTQQLNPTPSMAADGNLQEWMFVIGYVSFLVFIIGGVIVFSGTQRD